MDILEFMLPDQVWALANHLVSDQHPIYTTVVGNQIWYMKSDKGYPWDMNTFDDALVYQSITELNWNDPKQFKIFASASWTGANGGIAWSPRMFAPSQPINGLLTSDSSYRVYSACNTFKTQNLGGPILTWIDGPYERNFNGDLKEQDAIRLSYYWGSSLENLEVDWYAKGFGWVQWELWKMAHGQYVQNQVTAFNRFASGGNLKPVFPCGVPVIP